MHVWTEAEQWNVGMKFWNEGTMKNGWVGAARVRKVEKKKGTARGSRDQKAGNWGRGKTERQIGLNSEPIAPKRSPDREKKATITSQFSISRFVLSAETRIKRSKRNHKRSELRHLLMCLHLMIFLEEPENGDGQLHKEIPLLINNT